MWCLCLNGQAVPEYFSGQCPHEVGWWQNYAERYGNWLFCRCQPFLAPPLLHDELVAHQYDDDEKPDSWDRLRAFWPGKRIAMPDWLEHWGTFVAELKRG